MSVASLHNPLTLPSDISEAIPPDEAAAFRNRCRESLLAAHEALGRELTTCRMSAATLGELGRRHDHVGRIGWELQRLDLAEVIDRPNGVTFGMLSKPATVESVGTTNAMVRFVDGLRQAAPFSRLTIVPPPKKAKGKANGKAKAEAAGEPAEAAATEAV